MRFAEIALLALPLLVFVAWRMVAPSGAPPKVMVLGVAGAVAVMAVLLLAFWYEEAAPPNALYVPAQQVNGRIVPPQVESPADSRAGRDLAGSVPRADETR